MKRKVLFVGLFLVVTVMSIQFNSRKENLKTLMLENLDALASDEWESNAICAGTGSVDCPVNHTKVEYIVEGYNLENYY